MTWLDIGNGWRNIYLLSCMLQAGTLGVLFATHHWFSKRSRAACFLTGVAVTPLIQYLWTLVLAFVWPHAPQLVYIGTLPLASALVLLVMLLLRIKQIPMLLAQGCAFLKRVLSFDKPALIALSFALCLLILLAPVGIRYCSSMDSMNGGDAGEYMGLALNYCEDRDIQKLLEKEELVGHYRGHSHFPSLELYMSYGLFHTGDELGYPYDKPAFTGIGLLSFYMVAAYLALLLVFCRERKRWVLLGALLLNLVPDLVHSVAGAPRDIWRIVALMIAMLVYAGLEPSGNWKKYAGKLLLSFVLCFTVMSAHVVCFVVLPFIVIAWVLWQWMTSAAMAYRGGGHALVRSIGVALAGAAGTVVAFLGNIWCYVKWGEMSPWRLMTTYTTAPWYNMYMDIEYKLDETTTHVSFLQAKDDILMGYATPIGTWGWRMAVIALVVLLVWLMMSRVKLHRDASRLIKTAPPHSDGPTYVQVITDSKHMDIFKAISLCMLLTLCTLAPMSGILDSKLYSFSGAFLKLSRYTLQWFMLGAVMICAALSAAEDLWAEGLSILPACLPKVAGWFESRRMAGLKPYIKRIPAYLCVLLCTLSFVQGTKQTGYANSFYRYSRNVMEDQELLLDNSFQKQYGLLREVAAHVGEDQKILITRVGYQYALGGKGYVLTTNPIVHLLDLPLEEVETELAEMNAVLLATQPDFWDNRYYPLSTLAEYLRSLPEEQVVETEEMRLYILDPSLIPYANISD